jgi:hypothetical protein
MHVSLRHAASRVTKEARNRQLGETEVTGHTRERMPKDVRRDLFELCLGAYSIQHADHSDEVPVTPSRLEKRTANPGVQAQPRCTKTQRLREP